MLGFKEKEKIQKWLKDQTLTRNLSFALQKEQIQKKYPKSFLATESQTLTEYMKYVLENFPMAILKSGYILDSVECLYREENHYLVRPTKELYPVIAKKHAVSPTKIERSLRFSITKYFLDIPKNTREELFSVSEGQIPTNFLFLSNLTDYIKASYYSYHSITLTEEQKKYFFAHLKLENNALYKIEQAKLKQEIAMFLTSNLGHFKYQASESQFLLVELIWYCMNNQVSHLQEFYEREEIRKRWQFTTLNYFYNKMNGLSFTITNAHPFINPEIYQEIFGDCTLHRKPFEYITNVSTYLKEQEFVRSLKR